MQMFRARNILRSWECNADNTILSTPIIRDNYHMYVQQKKYHKLPNWLCDLHLYYGEY